MAKGTSFSTFANRVMLENRDSQMSVGSGSARSSIEFDGRSSITELPRVSQMM